MTELPATFFDGMRPLAHPVTITLEGHTVTLTGADFQRAYPQRELQVSPRIASAPRFVTLPDLAQLECADGPWLDALRQDERTEGPVAWLEQRWWAALSALALTALALALGYFFVLDATTDKIALRVPVTAERAFGDRVATSLAKVMRPTSLDTPQTEGIRAGFAELKALVPDSAEFTLEFRDSPGIGVNAFTLPGGRIIVTDQLVKAMPGDDEVLAVIAHELGHAHYRHTLRQAVRSSGVAVLGGVLLGDASSMAAGMTAAMQLVMLKYSRGFEAQADDYAGELLQKSGRSPELFAQALVYLDEDAKTRGLGEGYSFLSTHPVTEERMARARAAAKARTP